VSRAARIGFSVSIFEVAGGTGMSDHDLWHVKLSEGCVVEMTLDEIDTAFNAGRINAATAVMAPGDFRWRTLGEAAGLEDEVLEIEPEPAPYSIAPVAADVTPPPPSVDMDAFEVDVELATAAGLPQKRGMFGKVVGGTAFFGCIIALGVVGGAYAARPVEFKAKVASVRDRITHAPAQTVAVATPAPPPPPVQSSREIPPPPPAVAAPIPTMQASTGGTSVASLPDAKASKKKPTTKKR
jgi:hypothetical protein